MTPRLVDEDGRLRTRYGDARLDPADSVADRATCCLWAMAFGAAGLFLGGLGLMLWSLWTTATGR